MNKLLQYMIGAGNVSDKFLPHLAKAKKGYTALPMYQSKGQVRERLNSFNDDYLKAKSDATRVAPQRIITNQQSFKNKLQRDAEELQRRKQAIAISNAARNKPFSAKNLADESGAIGDKLRFFPNDPDSFIDEYINPFKMIGDMASGLGRIPLNIQQGNYGQAAMAVATPLAVGALSGIGAKNVGQFANNLVNPLAGTGDLVSNLVAKRAAPVSSFQLSRLPNSFDSGVQQELYRTVDRADINTLPSLNRLRNQTINTEGIVRNTPIDYSTLVDNSRNWTGYRPKDWGASIWGTRPSSTFKPEVVNRSGLTKNEIISKAAGKDKDIVSKMSEKDFQDSVFKPTGEVSPYEQVNTYDKFTGDNEIFNMSADEYAETFNSRLDLLNDIINTNNKSGLQYNVEKLTPEGRLIFNTPKQSVPTVLNDMQKARLSEFTANPQKFISEYAPLNKLDDGTWRFPDEVELGTYTSKEDAVADFTNRINKEFGPKEISGKTDWSVGILPGQWRGTVEDVANADYYRRIPGLNMQASSEGVFADRVARRGSGAYESINEYLKRLDLGRVKPGFNSQTDYSRGLWENAVKKGKAFGYYNNPNTVYGSMKAVAPIAIPTGIGAAALSEQRYGGSMYKQQGGPIIDPRGQWAHPGKVTRIPSPNITMQGVNYPVFGVGSNGQEQIMYPEQEYDFGNASYVDEYPMMKNGGGLLSKTVSCSNCGHSWKGVEGGIDPLNCHKCGGLVKMQRAGEVKKNPYTEVNSSAADTFRSLVPLPDNAAQMLAKVVFQDARMSNNSLSDDQKLILWNTIQNAKKRSGKNSGGGTEYQDYGDQGYGSSDEFNQWFNKGKVGVLDGSYKSLTNPGFKLASTIGRGRYWQDPNNPDDIQYTDVYDWNPSEANFKGSNAYQLLRNQLRSGEDKNLNKDKNDNYRMNFKLSKKEIEEIKKRKEEKDKSFMGLGLFKSGGQHGGLDRWFAEKWVDVKTGKDCGRQEGEKRAGYPACRPSKRVSSKTPKTSSEMSSSEKAKFKASKTSSERINYNHKRNK